MYIQHAWDAAVVGLWQVQVAGGKENSCTAGVLTFTKD